MRYCVLFGIVATKGSTCSILIFGIIILSLSRYFAQYFVNLSVIYDVKKEHTVL